MKKDSDTTNSFVLTQLRHKQSLRVAIAHTTAITKEVKKIHNLDPLTTIAVGRALSCSAVLGTTLKDDDQYVQCRFQGDGPINSIISEFIAPHAVRAFIAVPQLNKVLGPEDPLPESVGGAIGSNGTVTVKVGNKDGDQPYTGTCELSSGEIAEDLAHYFYQSEQLPTIIAAGVHQSPLGEVLGAGALLIQKVAGTDLDDKVFKELELRISQDLELSKLIAEGIELKDVLNRILPEDEVETEATKPVHYMCFCSRDKMRAMLVNLGKEEIDSIWAETGKLEVCCHFCSSKYNFTPDELLSH